MAANYGGLTRPPLLSQISSSSSLTSSSLYTLPGMELPLHDLGSAASVAASTPSSMDEKPLPPSPSGRRPSSSVYSARSEDHFGAAEAQTRLPSTEFFLQPVAFSYSNPNLSERNKETVPMLQPKVYSPSDDTPNVSGYSALKHTTPILLEPRTYSPPSNPRSNHPKRRSAHTGVSTNGSRHVSSPHAILQFPFNQSIHTGSRMSPTSQNLTPSPGSSATVEAVDCFTDPKTPILQQLRSVAAEHARSASTEKAKTALGMDSKTLQEDSERRKHRLFARHHYHPSLQTQEKARTMMSTSPRASTLLPQSLPEAMVDDDGPDSDAYVFTDDYHDQLAAQYRSSHDHSPQRPSTDSASKDMRLVPQPLFWQRQKRHSANKSPSPQTPTSKSPRSIFPFGKANHSPTKLFGGVRSGAAAAGSPPLKRSKSQKRREDLKASIKFVGPMDPNAVSSR